MRGWCEKMNLLLFEHISIPEGLKFTDHAIKHYQVKLEKHDIRCPGRYVSLLSGSEANIKSLNHLIMTKESIKFISVKCLYNLSPSLMSKTNSALEPNFGDDLLVIETKYLIDGYFVLDHLIKRIDVDQFTILSRLGLFGKGIVMVSGKSNSIQMGLKALESIEIFPLIKSAEVIRKSSFEKIVL